MGSITDAYNYFLSQGWSSAQAAGIVGNLHYESGGLNTGALGDGGSAYGLAQWHPDRQSIFQKVFGKSIKGSTFEEQLAFVNYELNNSESRAGALLRKTTNVQDATRVFAEAYERPANMSSLPARVKAAASAIGNGEWDIGGIFSKAFGLAMPGGAIATAANEAANAVTGAVPGTGLLAWLQELFSFRTAARFSAVFIGIVLIGLAIAALVLLSDNGKQIIKEAV
jgi:hypothetical protein